MQQRPLGQSGIQASVVVFGAWAIGGLFWGGTDEQDSIEAIHAALDAGINCIDTAPVYGYGLSERLVGKAIEGRRDEIVLATKCGLRWDDANGEFHFNLGGKDDKDVYKYLHPDSIRYEVEQSLKRLNTDRIDLYQTHWQENVTAVEDTMAALIDLKQQGKIRAIGVSNCTAERMNQYEAVGPLDADQEKFSMIDRKIESDQLPHCREKNMAVLAYSPMGMGLLTGKVDPERELPKGDIRRTNPRFSKENRVRVIAMLNEMKPVAEQYGLTFAQLALAWTIRQPGVTHALAGARNAKQAAENAKAGEVILSDEDVIFMDQIIEKHRGNLV
ncbi:MAG: aldo/keto reductase [bacterium]|nr:aldo/keto reductase [bacterium]